MKYEKLVENIEALSSRKKVAKTKALVDSGAGKNFIYNIQQGSEPSIEKIKQLADYFDTDIDRLLGKDPIESNISEIIPASQIFQIPVFETVSAGFGAYASDEIVDYIATYIKNPSDAKSTIGIKVQGDSMSPKIESGDTIVVRKQAPVDSGSIAVILIDNEEGVVKKVKYEPGCDWVDLISINPYYPVRRFQGDDELSRLRIVGLVKQVIKTL